MSDKDTCEQAFPRPGFSGPRGFARPVDGMTLRDYFAGQAMIMIPHIGCGSDLELSEVAHDAYAMADAMLEARQ